MIVTEWDAFRALDLGRLAGIVSQKKLIDLRNVYRRAEVERAGGDDGLAQRRAALPLARQAVEIERAAGQQLPVLRWQPKPYRLV